MTNNLIIMDCIFGGIFGIFGLFVASLFKIVSILRETNADLQRQIDDLKRELEEMKGKE